MISFIGKLFENTFQVINLTSTHLVSQIRLVIKSRKYKHLKYLVVFYIFGFILLYFINTAKNTRQNVQAESKLK